MPIFLCLIFNHNTISLNKSEKYRGIILNYRLDFKNCLEIIFKKVDKTIGLLQKLQNLFPRKSLVAIFKSL